MEPSTLREHSLVAIRSQGSCQLFLRDDLKVSSKRAYRGRDRPAHPQACGIYS